MRALGPWLSLPAIMAHPQTDFDRWFRDQLQEIFAVDLTALPGPSNELLGSFVRRGARVKAPRARRRA
jgi:hypothetical protein